MSKPYEEIFSIPQHAKEAHEARKLKNRQLTREHNARTSTGFYGFTTESDEERFAEHAKRETKLAINGLSGYNSPEWVVDDTASTQLMQAFKKAVNTLYIGREGEFIRVSRDGRNLQPTSFRWNCTSLGRAIHGRLTTCKEWTTGKTPHYGNAYELYFKDGSICTGFAVVKSKDVRRLFYTQGNKIDRVYY